MNEWLHIVAVLSVFLILSLAVGIIAMELTGNWHRILAALTMRPIPERHRAIIIKRRRSASRLQSMDDGRRWWKWGRAW
jgi:hypothetical protein